MILNPLTPVASFNSIIEMISKKLKIDFNYFFKMGFSINLRLFVDLLFGFLFIYFLSNTLSEETMGLYFFITSAFSLLAILSLPGFEVTAISSFLSHYYSSYLKIYYYRFLGSLIGFVISLSASVFSYYFYPQYMMLFLIISFFIPIHYLKVYLKYLYSKDYVFQLTSIAVVEKIIMYSIPIYYTLMGFSLEIILISYFLPQLAYNLFFSIFYYFVYIRHENLSKKDDKLLENGFKMSLNHGLIIGSTHLDKIIFPFILTLQQLSIYSIALLLPQKLFSIIVKVFQSLFFKKTHKLSIQNLFLKIKSFWPLIILFFIGSIVFLIVSFPYFYHYLFPKYEESVFFAQLLCLIVPFVCVNQFIRKFLESNSYINNILIFDFILAVINIILFVPLTFTFGILGAIIAKLLYYIISFLCYLYVFYGIYRKEINE